MDFFEALGGILGRRHRPADARRSQMQYASRKQADDREREIAVTHDRRRNELIQEINNGEAGYIDVMNRLEKYSGREDRFIRDIFHLLKLYAKDPDIDKKLLVAFVKRNT